MKGQLLRCTISLMTDLEKMSRLQNVDPEMLRREMEIQATHDALEIDASREVFAERIRAERTDTHQ